MRQILLHLFQSFIPRGRGREYFSSAGQIGLQRVQGGECFQRRRHVGLFVVIGVAVVVVRSDLQQTGRVHLQTLQSHTNARHIGRTPW